MTSSPSTEAVMLVSGSVEELTRRARGPVRRNLFGPLDHEQLQQDFHRLLCKSVESATKRWDFDFTADRPTQGSTVEWEEVKCQDVPLFYRSCVARKPVLSIAEGRAEREKIMPVWPASPGSSSSGEEYLEVTTRESYRIQRPEKKTARQRSGAVKRRQAAITEFFAVKKMRAMKKKR
ncbi:cyclin-dependent kinase inhibitor 1-like [Esox lucius]|uniref:Cyclin-dependent kinase inhibitor domain-containing protein n=1 Tax=Esox lucius TaxID=8010 RepID=A0A3P8YHF5_ESOLU|nr:cyclin-dependent kinase inhibitor 1-like [Esox lucius]XP_010900528.1 cyclin-dependent kinase inhibitor 1-like [Esox lucius]